MIVTTYTCDKCGHVQTSHIQMWNLVLTVSALDDTHHFIRHEHKALWCRECVEKIGFLPTENEAIAEAVKAAPPTMEDIIREIVRAELA